MTDMHQSRILIIGQLPGYEQNGRIYGVVGLAPTIQSRDYKDAPKIGVEVHE